MLFKNHRLSFNQADPLENGLGEEIFHEKLEPEAITLEEGIDEDALAMYWQNVENDLRNDPEFVSID